MTGGDEKKKLSPVTIIATALAAVTSMVVGSFFGTGGTVWGVFFGSVVSGSAATWYENWTRTAHAKVRARKEQAKYAGRVDDGTLMGRVLAKEGGEEALIGARVRRELRHQGWGWGRRAGFAAGMAGLCLAVTLVTLTGVEAATGRTFATTFSSHPQHGTTLGGWTAPSASVSPSVTPSAVSPDLSPSSPSPDATPSPVSPSADASPDATPDESPSTPFPGGSGIIGSP